MAAIKWSLNDTLCSDGAFFIRKVVILTVVVLNLFNNQTVLAPEGFYL